MNDSTVHESKRIQINNLEFNYRNSVNKYNRLPLLRIQSVFSLGIYPRRLHRILSEYASQQKARDNSCFGAPGSLYWCIDRNLCLFLLPLTCKAQCVHCTHSHTHTHTHDLPVRYTLLAILLRYTARCTAEKLNIHCIMAVFVLLLHNTHHVS